MDPVDFAASFSDEQIPAALEGLFRRRAGIEDAIAVLLGEIERRRAYRHQPGHHNGALRGRAVPRVDASSHGRDSCSRA